MKKIKLLDLFNSLDDKLIEQSIEIDNAKKLKEIKKLEKKKKISVFSKYIFISTTAILLLAFILPNLSNENNTTQTKNPIIEVTNLNELEKFINKDLSKYKIKTINRMIKYNEEEMIEIEYKDLSTLRISKGNTDNSGIYGATLKEETNINNTKITIYEYENITYATWTLDNYSYSYIASTIENINEILKKII